MTVTSHVHDNSIIVDSDSHFTIDTITRMISNQANKKIALEQYDHNSERYSFDVDRIIDGHDLLDCNRVQIHYINMSSSKQKHAGLYLVDDVHVSSSDENKITFTWLISNNATMYSGILSFLISFECVNGDTILYRWSSSIFNSIQITAGMDNGDYIIDEYADELLIWEKSIEEDFIPNLVNECYINRDFATSEEVAYVLGLTTSDVPGLIHVTPYEEVTDADIDSLFNEQGE